MSCRICWHCLAKSPRTFTPAPRYPTKANAPFSTTTKNLANPPKARSTSGQAALAKQQKAARGAKQGFAAIRRKKQLAAGFTPKRVIGPEQKELQKRVVLSNTNALQIKDQQEICLDLLTQNDSGAKVLALPGTVVDKLKVVDAFKPKQMWKMFRWPSVLVRDSTLEYAQTMNAIEEEKKTTRRVLVGDRKTGKTAMLLQAMMIGFMKGWVVINIPRAQDLTLAFTDYIPTTSTKPTNYAQPTYTASLLSAIARANPLLSDINLSGQHSTQPPSPSPSTSSSTSSLPNIPADTSLSHLCTLGSTNPEIAPQIFTLLTRELQVKGRPPLLLCLDGLHFAMTQTRYRDADFNPIHAHQFQMIDWFLSHLSGSAPLPNGGMVLAATSAAGDNPRVPTLDYCVAKEEADAVAKRDGKKEGEGDVQPDPWAKYDERVLKVFVEKGGVEVDRLGGLSREETRGLLEYWARSGVFPRDIDAERVGREWTVSGGGVVGELERACLRGGGALQM